MKTKLVIFTSNNARILINGDPAEYPGALLNPDLSAVKGIAPHFWKLEDGKIVPMSGEEQSARLKDHEERGVDNNVNPIREEEEPVAQVLHQQKWTMPSKTFWIGLAGAIASFLAGLSL